ncbi:MAG: S9 family peptidase [Hyphomicrobiales bacterium]|nr:S9 family peptidase [Hyphomicrobiales bacterium]MBV8826823.1 S9 family peptidase [Hyphomicrobiales bacterium]MBV9426166.1 S9 family peptidase [Bradyrhizobiaceae bacterium]
MLERAKLAPAGLAEPPRAEPRPHTSTRHGVTLTDEYAWLKAPNWQEVMRDPAKLDPAIRAYLEAENAYAAAALAETAPLQEKLFAEMKGRIEEDESTVPSADGPYAYFVRYREGGQHPILCREPRGGGAAQTLLDGDALGAGKSYFSLGGFEHSPDHKLLAWSADETGSEFNTIRVRDLATGADLPDAVPDATGEAVWSDDGRTFLYVRLDENHRPSRVYRHRLGTAPEADALVYEEAEPGYFVSVSGLQSRRFAEISIHGHDTSESRLIDLTVPDAAPFIVAPREISVRYSVEHHPTLFGDEVLVIRTNADGAEDFKIVWTPLRTPGREHWRDFVPHRAGVYLLSLVMLRDWLVRLEREDGLPRIVTRHLGTNEEHAIAFAEEAYSLGMDGGFEFATDLLRFTYSSMTTPAEVWDYDLGLRTRTLRKRQKVPSGHDPADYVTRRVMAPAADGETVPISVLYRNGLALDGTAPCLLYGYGAYGFAIPAAFSTSRLSLVDRGFVYAIAHVRGGTEKGWRWYREGKLSRKPNTFHDFIAAADYLIKSGWVARDKVVAHGGSAGGMLMGAIANLRPDLFGGIVAEVPFVDVLNTMLDDTLPLTPPEWPEWGNPITDVQAFRDILSYSPYDNVRAQAYPPILALAGLTDPRVTYWEPAKWVARLRAKKTGSDLVVLRTNMDAGHAGAAGRFDRLKEVALSYAFALMVAGAAELVPAA